MVLWQVDRESLEATAREILMDVVPPPASVAVGDGFVWVPSRGDNQVLRLDPAAGEATAITVDRQPVAVAFANGAVWAANSRDGTVSRIDPRSRAIETIPVGGTPADLVAGEDGLWVTVRP